jgi:5-methylcytosine-specific restriction protein A
MAGGWQNTDTTRTTTPEHRAWRLAVLKRDSYLCQLKGKKCTGKATEADHILADADGGLLTMDNGRAVCHTCHAERTSRDANAKRWANRGNFPDEMHPGLR